MDAFRQKLLQRQLVHPFPAHKSRCKALRQVARRVPLERCLIETDSPYLAPVPYRGKINQPAYVPYVAAQLALLKDCSVQQIAQATSRNFERLFARVGVESGLDSHEERL